MSSTARPISPTCCDFTLRATLRRFLSHPHATDGILHTETKTPEPNSLGQFFVQWDVPFDSSCVGDYCAPDTPIGIYVDGDSYDGDPREIELSDGREIAIVIGTPPDPIPADFQQ